MGKFSVAVTGDQFREMLEQYELTDTNAAKIFGVTDSTVKLWVRRGLSGTAAAHFVKFLLDQNIPPSFVAQRLGIGQSPFPRSMYTAVRAQSREWFRTKAKPELSAADLVVKYLFQNGNPTPIIALKQALPDLADEMFSVLNSLIEAETVELSGIYYTLAPFAQLKLATQAEAKRRA